MEWVTIKAEPRNEKGTRACRHLRAKGLVPVVIYGRKEPEEMLAVNRKEAMQAYQKGLRLVNLAFSGKTEKVMVKEIQYDQVREELLHIDFNRIALDELITMEVEIKLKGHPKGVTTGGVLEQNLHQLTVKCLPTNIPPFIEVDVSPLETGGLVRVKDLVLPAGVTPVTDANIVVAGVHQPKVEEIAPAAEITAAEPEVITAKKETPEEAAAKEGKEVKDEKKAVKEEKKAVKEEKAKEEKK